MTNKQFKQIRDKINKPRKWISFQLGVSPQMISVYSYREDVIIPDVIADIMEEMEGEL